MSEHYYTGKPTVKHDTRTLKETLRGIEFTFVTDAGVFSKGGVDYGSKALIRCMEIPDGARVLDVGCGYGPIGLTAATLSPSSTVTMLDVNERAVELSRENARMNGIGNTEVFVSDGVTAVKGRSFDCVLTNPPIRAGKEVVHRIFEEAAECLVPGGKLWVVIQKKQGAPSAFAKLETMFTSVREVEKDKGYRIIVCEK
ncbi:class I SAM-dependent methyltransferase [Gorillibacterium timonense]|uniref:class I SAM-dependent methyltransferase n=1 Tax=Gorillibacterium timonense TaxID=1689269 RepID=UPI00071CEBDF|nr:class I SAM-dependent methyltransferase [Gorillibacterium timonense]